MVCNTVRGDNLSEYCTRIRVQRYKVQVCALLRESRLLRSNFELLCAFSPCTKLIPIDERTAMVAAQMRLLGRSDALSRRPPYHILPTAFSDQDRAELIDLITAYGGTVQDQREYTTTIVPDIKDHFDDGHSRCTLDHLLVTIRSTQVAGKPHDLAAPHDGQKRTLLPLELKLSLQEGLALDMSRRPNSTISGVLPAGINPLLHLQQFGRIDLPLASHQIWRLVHSPIVQHHVRTQPTMVIPAYLLAFAASTWFPQIQSTAVAAATALGIQSTGLKVPTLHSLIIDVRCSSHLSDDLQEAFAGLVLDLPRVSSSRTGNAS